VTVFPTILRFASSLVSLKSRSMIPHGCGKVKAVWGWSDDHMMLSTPIHCRLATPKEILFPSAEKASRKPLPPPSYLVGLGGSFEMVTSS